MRKPSLVRAQKTHDASRSERRIVLRLSESELEQVGRLKRSDETVAAFFRRLLREVGGKEK